MTDFSRLDARKVEIILSESAEVRRIFSLFLILNERASKRKLYINAINGKSEDITTKLTQPENNIDQTSDKGFFNIILPKEGGLVL